MSVSHSLNHYGIQCLHYLSRAPDMCQQSDYDASSMPALRRVKVGHSYWRSHDWQENFRARLRYWLRNDEVEIRFAYVEADTGVPQVLQLS